MGDVLKGFSDSLIDTFSSAQPNPQGIRALFTILAMVVLILVVFFIVYSIASNSGKEPRVADVNVALATQSRIGELDSIAAFTGEIVLGEASASNTRSEMNGQNSLSSLINSLDPSEQYLVNLCPLTASIGGYIGPLKDGIFNPTYYLSKALRAGIRSFVLPISVYYDDNKKPPNWPYSRKPAIVCRNNDGKIQSLNGMTIQKFCEAIVQYKMDSADSREPILIYLDATTDYIPNHVKKEKEYVQLTSDIAKELKVLDKYRLILLGSYGSAVGGERQSEILTQIPLKELENKVLIFTNFDINIATKKAYSSISPVLYDYVNFVYKPVTAANVGTTVVGQTQPGARSIHISDISGSSINWTDQARVTWYFTGGDKAIEVPDAQLVDTVTTLGIQSVPIPFFFLDLDKTYEIWKQWGGYSWRLKPQAARYSKPAPIVPQNPSTSLNARVVPSLQPGQLVVK